MKKLIFTAILITLFLKSYSQLTDPKTLSWLNSNAIDLHSNYLKSITKNLKNNQILGIAEASHGTEDFFEERNKIIKYLIKNENYKILGLEFRNNLIKPVNQYILTGNGNLKTIMNDFKLYKTKSFYDLIEWLKNYNSAIKTNKIEIFGFDDEEFTNPFSRDSLMAVNTINKQMESKAKLIVYVHNLHLAKGEGDGYKPYGYFLNKAYKNAYYNIAFDTFEGSVNTISFNADESTSIDQNTLIPSTDNFTAIFAKMKYENFYIHFDTENPLAQINSNITNIYANWRAPFTLRTRFNMDFDALIFIKKTNASVMLH